MKLQLTLQMLANELFEDYSKISVHSSKPANLKKAALLSSAASFDNPFCLYCGNYEEIPEHVPKDTCFLFTRMPAEKLTLHNYIVVSTEQPVELVFMQVQEILIQIWSWYAHVLEVSSTSTDFHELLAASIPVFKDPFYFHSIFHDCFFHPDGSISSEDYWEAIIRTYYEPDAPSVPFSSDILAVNHSQRTPTLVSIPNTKEHYLSYNVFLDDIRMGAFVVTSQKKQMRGNYSIYLQILSACSNTMFKKLVNAPEFSLSNALIRLLKGEMVTSETFLSLCQKENWIPKGRTFRILVIKPHASNKDTFFIEQLLYHNIIARLCGKNKIIFHKGTIVVVRDLTEENKTNQSLEAFKKIQFFSKKIHANIGISIPFSDLNQIQIFYEQANTIARNQGKTLQSEETTIMNSHIAPLHEYSYYLLYDIIRNFSTNRSLNHYIHPDVTKLAEYDKGGKNHLLLSLYYYLLNDRSYQDCADKLFVHRNTFAYRIKKALSIITDDLTDENVRLSVLLSICMYWYLNPGIDPIGISEWNQLTKE